MSVETVQEISSGLMDDGYHWFVPGTNAIDCGQFVGRDGSVEIECFEMSTVVASVSGQCARCSAREGANEGEPDCPACWVHDIRAALTGAAESHGERPPGPGTPADPVSGGTVQHSGRESGPDA